MTDKKNILVLADGFGAPAYTPRLRTFCNYLADQGYHVHVIVEKVDRLIFAHAYPIDEIQLYTGSKIDWALKNIWSLIADWKNRRFSQIVEERAGKSKWDIVFCTTYNTFPLRAAIEFGKRHHIPVHIDLRDIAEQAPKNAKDYVKHKTPWLRWLLPLYIQVSIYRRNHWLRLADTITSVSPWHQKLLSRYNTQSHLIYNGFDPTFYFPQNIISDDFLLSYTGKYFGRPLQDPTILLEALQQLKGSIPIRVEIHTNMEGQQLLRQLVQQYGVSDMFSISGYISPKEAIALRRKSSILLIFSNQASDHTGHGMMTTKFFEALGMEKPVLCVRSDEECLADIIQQTHAGIAATAVEDIVTFIKDKYAEWEANGYTHQVVKNKEPYSRINEAQQLEQLITQTIQRHT